MNHFTRFGFYWVNIAEGVKKLIAVKKFDVVLLCGTFDRKREVVLNLVEGHITSFIAMTTQLQERSSCKDIYFEELFAPEVLTNNICRIHPTHYVCLQDSSFT